jgi:16S rRNA (cytidine1402-2'-O)-methyltransferase
MTGHLVLVGTPIGNLGDISVRAKAALAGAEVILCEDTRRTRKLLSALEIPAPRLVRLDQTNETELLDRVVDMVESGVAAVLVSDAGMPTISDPGTAVVRACAQAGIDVQVVPGPTAVSAALALSGLPASRFRFEGFLARKGRDRAGQLESIGRDPMTTVVYEAPHRVARTVADLAEVCGPDRQVALVREVTKLHEEVWRGSLGEASERLRTAPDSPRGEWVLVIGGRPAKPARADDPDQPHRTSATPSDEDILGALRRRTADGMDRRQAVAEVASHFQVPKRRVYNLSVGRPGRGQ